MKTTWLVALFVVACTGDKNPEDVVDDADADTDADSDSDADTDTDTDTEPLPDADGDGFAEDVDCDDADDSVYPGAPDLCGDDRVTDCDRTADEGIVTLDETQGFDDLGDALLAAGSDSVILVCPGTYTGNFEVAVPVRLVAHGDPAATILDGGANGTTLSVPGGSEVVGLTITRGDSNQSGGGIRLTSSGALLVQDSVVRGNRARLGAGIAIAPAGIVTLVDSVVEENVAEEGGGGVLVPAGAVLDLSATSSVSSNVAELYGAGVHLDGGALVGGSVTENTLESYPYFYYSGGVLEYEYPFGGAGVSTMGATSITGSAVNNNVAALGGGGVANSAGELVLTDVEIQGNSSEIGGGFAVVDGTLRMEGTTEVFANTAFQAAGGMAIVGTVVGGVVRDNVADDFGGGIVPFTATIEDTVVSGNVASNGGGIFVLGEVTLRNTTITANRALEGAGIGSLRDYSAEGDNFVTIEGGALTANSGELGGAVLTVWPMSITDTVIADNTAVEGAGLFVDRGEVTMSGGSVVRNVAAELGGGVRLANDASSFVATAVDFGEGVEDNLPGDVSAADTEVVGYGPGATFSCDDAGCTPAP